MAKMKQPARRRSARKPPPNMRNLVSFVESEVEPVEPVVEPAPPVVPPVPAPVPEPAPAPAPETSPDSLEPVPAACEGRGQRTIT